MSLRDVYDIETPIEKAIAALLTDSLAALTPSDDPQFQKERPRAEVECILGQGKGHMVDLSAQLGMDSSLAGIREDAWDLAVQIFLVTDAVDDLHADARALVRSKMAMLPSLINGTSLTNHVIYTPVTTTGCSPRYEPENGAFMSILNFQLTVSIHADAWAKLLTT